MSDSITRWWPKSGCTMSIDSMDDAHAKLIRDIRLERGKTEKADADNQRLRDELAHARFDLKQASELARRNARDARRYRDHCRNTQTAVWMGLNPEDPDVLSKLDAAIDGWMAKSRESLS